MIDKPFTTMVKQAFEDRRRLVVPLMGFPGLQITGGTVKLAQQNYGEHYRTVKALAERFQPDLMFPLMDLSVEANALGRSTVFPKADSATVLREPYHREELEGLSRINLTFDGRLLGYVETLKLMSIGLPSTMMRGAYVTGPYSLAGLIMGADDAAMSTVLNPEELLALCEFTTERIQEYVRSLLAAGAQVICILEPSAVMLGPDEFERFSAQFVRHINDSVKYTGAATVYHTCGNTMHLVMKMVAAGVDAVSLDSPVAGVDLPTVAEMLPPHVAIVGNINPTGALLHGTQEDVEDEVDDLLDAMEPYPNFVLSTGCDLPQEVPLANIEAFMRAGRRHRLKKRS